MAAGTVNQGTGPGPHGRDTPPRCATVP